MMNNIKNKQVDMDSIADVALFLAPAHADSKKEGIDVHRNICLSHNPRRLHLA